MSEKGTAMDAAIEIREPIGTDGRKQPSSALPTLDLIIDLICRDAHRDSMRYVLRSDVGLDGE
jgi:hypothetical protein